MVQAELAGHWPAPAPPVRSALHCSACTHARMHAQRPPPAAALHLHHPLLPGGGFLQLRRQLLAPGRHLSLGGPELGLQAAHSLTVERGLPQGLVGKMAVSASCTAASAPHHAHVARRAAAGAWRPPWCMAAWHHGHPPDLMSAMLVTALHCTALHCCSCKSRGTVHHPTQQLIPCCLCPPPPQQPTWYSASP
jgi:hypothetical protein